MFAGLVASGRVLMMLPAKRLRHVLGGRLLSPSKLILIALNLTVYVLLLTWVGENIQLARLSDYIHRIPIWALLGSLAINLAALVLYGARLALLLRKDFCTSFSIVNLGYALNTLLPLRLGDAVKIYLGHKLFRLPVLAILAASVAEKLVDLGKVVLLGAIVVAFTASEFIKISALVSVTVFVLVSIGAVALFRLYIVRIIRMAPKGNRLRRILIELHKHASGYSFSRILAVTAGIWALNIALVFFSFNTYLPGTSIGLLDAVALLLIMALAIATPSGPAGLGLFEAVIVVYLTQKLGVENEAALAAAVVFHLVITLPQVCVMGWLLWIRGSQLTKVNH